MSSERELAIRKSREAVGFLAELRDRISTFEAVSLRILDGLDQGLTMAECLTNEDGGTIRRQTTDTFAEFDSLRRDARLAMIRLALSEGMSKADVARAWGVSRQWASREADAAVEKFGAPHGV